MNTHIIQRMFCFRIECFVFMPDKKAKGFGLYLQANKREGDQVLQPPRQFLEPSHANGFQEMRQRGDFVPSALQSLMEKQDLGSWDARVRDELKLRTSQNTAVNPS